MKLFTKEFNKNFELQELFAILKPVSRKKIPLLFFNGNAGVDYGDLKTVGELSYVFVPETFEYYNEYFPNDVNKAIRSLDNDFKSQYLNRMRIISYLPEAILGQIKDKRLLAVGYVEKYVKSKLSSYLQSNRKRVIKVFDKVLNQCAEKALNCIDGLTIQRQLEENDGIDTISRLFEEEHIIKHKPKGKNLLIRLTGADVILKNFKVLEQETDPEDTDIKFFELYKNETQYELHFLLKKTQDDLIENFYYQTYSFSDMKMKPDEFEADLHSLIKLKE